MQEHSRYEELCASAAVGQISPAELTELHAHLRECEFCKELQSKCQSKHMVDRLNPQPA
jgi:hypothetical protein